MREEGPRALFKGLTPVMLRAFPANAVSTLGFIQVTSYVQVRVQHNKQYHMKVLVNSFHFEWSHSKVLSTDLKVPMK